MKKKINYSLEGLRGICAITVAFSHVQAGMIVLPHVNETFSYFHFAHTSVMIFFVLSGYVMGVNYGQRKFDKKEYLIKRFLRIYPIYFVAVLFSLLLENTVSANKALTAFFFLQGWGESLTSNVVFWSINYEVLFYLTFLFVPKQVKAIVLSIASCVILAFVVYRLNYVPQILGGYLAGFSFWLIGLLLARKEPLEMSGSKPLLSLLFMALAFEHISPGAVIFGFLNIDNGARQIVSIVDVFSIPLCVLILTEVGALSIHSNLRKVLFVYCFFIPSVILLGLIMKNRLFEDTRWLISLIFLVLAYSSLFLKSKINVLERLSFWGSISYAIYIIHFPVGYAISKLKLESNWVNIVFSLLAWAMVTSLVSWLLEKKLQPQIRKLVISPQKTVNGS